MKKLVLALVAIFTALTVSSSVFASTSSMPSVVDTTNTLTSSEISSLTYTLDSLRNAYDLDVVVVLQNSGITGLVEAYVDDYYDYNGYSADGIILLIDLASRDWAISTSGKAIRIFTDEKQDAMMRKVKPYLSDGDYYTAFKQYGAYVEKYCDEFVNGTPFNYTQALLIALAIGLVAGLVIVLVYMGQLKSVQRNNYAASYVKNGSVHIRNAGEIYLYTSHKRTPRPQQSSSSGHSSTHVSSSGRTHGGSHGKF